MHHKGRNVLLAPSFLEDSIHQEFTEGGIRRVLMDLMATFHSSCGDIRRSHPHTWAGVWVSSHIGLTAVSSASKNLPAHTPKQRQPDP